MSSDEETGYGSIEKTPKVDPLTVTSRRRRGVAVVTALAFGLVVLGGSSHSVPISGSFMGESVSQLTVIENGTRKTVTALIKMFGHSHKYHRCDPENGYHGGCCEPENGYYYGCEGHTAPPTDAPTSKPTASPTDAPGFFGRLFGD